MLRFWRHWGPAIIAGALCIGFAAFVWFVADHSSKPSPRSEIARSSEQEPKHEGTKSASDERIADYTWWLTFFTAVLSVVSLAQGIFLLRADKTGRIAANAAKRSADIVVDMERPRVRLDHIKLVVGSYDKPMSHYIAAHCIDIGFRNYGRSPAFLIGTHFDFYIGEKLPVPPKYREGWDRVGIIEPGKDLSWKWISATKFSDEDVGEIDAGEKILWMFGVLVYSGFTGEEYETGFCGAWTNMRNTGTPQVSFSSSSRSPYIYHT